MSSEAPKRLTRLTADSSSFPITKILILAVIVFLVSMGIWRTMFPTYYDSYLSYSIWSFEYWRGFLGSLIAPWYMHPFSTTQHIVRDLINTLIPAILISALVGSYLRKVNETLKRRQIALSDLGIEISYGDVTNRDGVVIETGHIAFIAWEDLTKVSLEETTFPIVRKKAVNLVFHDALGHKASIRWSDVLSSVDSGDFINELKTKAPQAVQGVTFPGVEKIVDQNSYTRLWFKYYSATTERKRSSELAEGDTLREDQYKIIGRVGGGGQGTAYLAQHRQNETEDVIVKEYILPLHRGNQVLQRTSEKLEMEADLLRKIEHPSIVKVLDCFVEDHRGYLVMEYVEGKSLKQIVDQQGPQSEETVRRIAMQICEILSYLHNLSPAVVHRDLTPDNLILQADGKLKLVDFNVAHQLESQATATVVGKHAYIPPEQFRGKPTEQSDLYALGCTLHYLLTAQEPEPITISRPKKLVPEVSDNLDGLIAKMTSLDPAKRPANCGEIAQELVHMGETLTINLQKKLLT